jgi:CRISPR/Cas system-associated exonuclease Cas4 (RecB family)
MRRETPGSSKRKRRNDRAGEALAEQLAAEVKEAFGNTAIAPAAELQEPCSSGVPEPCSGGVPTVAGPEAKALLQPTGPQELAQRKLSAEPIPARMLNEFVYCPRLFYYEYVEGVFVENSDTARGAALHERVDKGTGALPAAQSAKTDEQAEESSREEGDGGASESRSDKIHSRSVTLGSERLGVIAKLDLVETPGDEESTDLLSRLEVCPVDYKAGAPREGEDGNELWPTDRMQLGVQILILRDNGYRCNRGIIIERQSNGCPSNGRMSWRLGSWLKSTRHGKRCSDRSRHRSSARRNAYDVRSTRSACQMKRGCSLREQARVRS